MHFQIEQSQLKCRFCLEEQRLCFSECYSDRSQMSKNKVKNEYRGGFSCECYINKISKMFSWVKKNMWLVDNRCDGFHDKILKLLNKYGLI